MFCYTIHVLACQHRLKLTTVTFHANVSVYFTQQFFFKYLLKHKICAGIPGQHSGREQPFRAYFFDAWEFFSSDIPCSNRPQEAATTQYNAAVTRGSFSMPVAFKDPFQLSQFVFPGQCSGTEHSHQLGWFQRGVRLAFYSH